MPSSVMSQAIALSHAQAKRGQRKPAETPGAYIAPLPHKGDSFGATAFDALVRSRMRKAKYEIKAHDRMYPYGINK